MNYYIGKGVAAFVHAFSDTHCKKAVNKIMTIVFSYKEKKNTISVLVQE